MAVCHTSFNTAVNVVPNKVKKLELKLAAMAVCHTSFNTNVYVVPNKVKKLELKLAAMAVCHTSINITDHISEILNKEEGKGYESIASLPPFGPKEEHKWFFQISSQ
jgi:hypothetical protein